MAGLTANPIWRNDAGTPQDPCLLPVGLVVLIDGGGGEIRMNGFTAILGSPVGGRVTFERAIVAGLER